MGITKTYNDMGRSNEFEDLYERYNYKKMDKDELYDLVRKILTDKEIFAHFYLYEVARDALGD